MGPARREFVQLHVVGLVDHFAAGRIAGGKEVFGDGGLAVGHHRLAGIFPGVDEKARTVLPGDPGAVVRLAFAIHALAEPNLAQQRDRAGFQHAGANPLQTWPRVCRSSTMLSMPLRSRIWDSSRPAGPPPIMATWVRTETNEITLAEHDLFKK